MLREEQTKRNIFIFFSPSYQLKSPYWMTIDLIPSPPSRFPWSLLKLSDHLMGPTHASPFSSTYAAANSKLFIPNCLSILRLMCCVMLCVHFSLEILRISFFYLILLVNFKHSSLHWSLNNFELPYEAHCNYVSAHMSLLATQKLVEDFCLEPYLWVLINKSELRYFHIKNKLC